MARLYYYPQYIMNDKKVIVIVDNVRSALNVGSIFRTSDGAGVDKVYLCGITPTPNSSVREKISKTALGAEKSVSWEHYSQTWRLIKNLKKEGYNIVALEQSKKSIDIFKFKPKFPLALIVGNEVSGIRNLKEVNQIVEIPMRREKESLNVSVAFGIAIYQILK